MKFSAEQKLAYDKYIQGKNIFITGPGGTGKSALIKRIRDHAFSNGLDIHVCALTGCAAVLLECNAKTLHSWAGIGLGNGSTEYYIDKIKKNPFSKAIWKETDLLIVDEVSMMSQKMFEMLDAIGKAIRKSRKPFGGIQLIFSGDFYQLPPVGDREIPETVNFCFESAEWFNVFPKKDHVIMNKNFRQSDPVYQRILNQTREARLKRSGYEILMQHVGKTVPPDLIIKPTQLYPTRARVDNINYCEMSLLEGESRRFEVIEQRDLKMTQTEKIFRRNFTPEKVQLELDYLKGNLLCDVKLDLKIGSQVMCIVNIKDDIGKLELCNGSQGVVIDFCSIVTPEGESSVKYPLVKYTNGVEKIMFPHTWLSENIPGVGVSQIPLILAWALTIHKSQGATLDCAQIDAGSGIFECGQTYVALSRVKSVHGLYLTSFDPKRIRINKKVREFYEEIEEVFAPIREEINLNHNSDEEVEVEVEAVAVPVAIPVAEEVIMEEYDDSE